MNGYEPPVDRLLTIQPIPKFASEWPNYLQFGFGPESIPDLIRMATDPELNEGEADDPAVYAPVHAWRALGQLRAEAAAVPLVQFLRKQSEDEFDDWSNEEIPVVLGMIGPAAIPMLVEILEDDSVGYQTKIEMARALGEIGQRHPGAREESVAVLTRLLERADRNDPGLNGFLVHDLINLQARESAGVIERAYAGDFVDDSICGTWHDVWYEMDLEGDPPPETERRYLIGRDELDPFVDDPESVAPVKQGWQPTERRSPEQRKERNKARQKLEKKVKEKNRKKH